MSAVYNLKYVHNNFDKQSQIRKYINVVCIHYLMHFYCGDLFNIKWFNISLSMTNKQMVKFITDISSITKITSLASIYTEILLLRQRNFVKTILSLSGSLIR